MLYWHGCQLYHCLNLGRPNKCRSSLFNPTRLPWLGFDMLLANSSTANAISNLSGEMLLQRNTRALQFVGYAASKGCRLIVLRTPFLLRPCDCYSPGVLKSQLFGGDFCVAWVNLIAEPSLLIPCHYTVEYMYFPRIVFARTPSLGLRCVAFLQPPFHPSEVLWPTNTRIIVAVHVDSDSLALVVESAW